MPCGPSQRLIFPTSELCAATIQTGNTAGVCTPKVVPGDGDPSTTDPNCGTLTPVFSGVPATQTSLPAVICMTSSGGPGEAGFTYDATGASPLSDPVVVGQDEFWIQDHHTSFFSSEPDSYAPFSGTAAAFCEDSKLLVVAGAAQAFAVASSVIRLKRRSLLGENFTGVEGWSIVDVDTSLIPGAPDMAGESTGAVQIQVFQQKSVALEWLSNGTLLMAYTYFDAGNILRIAMLKSMDCGDTWALAHRVLNPVYEVIPKYGIQMRKSGLWVRVQWFADIPIPVSVSMVHAASGDLGSSFEESESSAFFPASNPSDADTAWSLVGLGGGSFAVMGAVGGSWQHVKTFGGDPFDVSQASTLNIVSGTQIYGLSAAICWDHVVVVVQHADGIGSNTEDQITVFRAKISEIQPGSGTDWTVAEHVTAWKGVRFNMRMMHSQCVGNRALWIGSTLWDESSASIEGGTHCFHLATISPRPMGGEPWGAALGFSGSKLIASWASHTQRPANTADASPDTGWSQIGPDVNVFYQVEGTTFLTPIGSLTYFHYQGPALPVWGSGGIVFGGVVSVKSGSSRLTMSHGMRLWTGSVVIQIQIGLDGVRVVEGSNAGVVLCEIITPMIFDTHVRVFFDENSAGNTVMLCLWEQRAPHFTFQEDSTTLPISTAFSRPNRLQFGGIGASVAGASQWREVFAVSDQEWSQRYSQLTSEPDFPGLLGIIAGPEICLDESLSVSFSGGSAFSGDKFTVLPCFEHPIENVFRDGCQLGWRSEFGPFLSGMIIEFEMDGENTMLGNTVWVCGVETDSVDVTVFNSGGAGSFTSTLDLTCFEGLQVFGAFNDVITYANTPVKKPFDGQLNQKGWRVRFTSGSHQNEIFCITEHCRNYFRLDSFDGPPDSVSPGDTFNIFKTSGWLNLSESLNPDNTEVVFPRQFLRLTFPPETHTCTDDPRLSGVMYGCSVDVPIPMQWTHSDDIQTDVQVFETAGGYSWGFERGPARRVWTGRVVNDYVRWREAVRALHGAIGWTSTPIVLIPDDSDPCTAIYGRMNPVSLDNSFWWCEEVNGETCMWPGGDIAIQITEVP